VGGEETIELLQLLGLAFPCEMDASMIVPYVHIFPLQVQYLKNNHHHGGKGQDSQQTATAKATSIALDTMILVTDLHPTILSRTTVGQKEDGAVMYIGPDSLALVQHLPTRLHVENVYRQKYQCGNTNDKEKEKSPPFRILDLCTGSGVQALYMLMSMRFLDPTATAVCVDVNDRALRFVRFNALLNGIERDRVWTLKADLVSGLCLEDFAREESSSVSSSSGGHGNVNIIDMLLHGAWHKQKPGNFGYNNITQGPFDLILANPPFIPTPSYYNDDESSCIPEDISKRYGLFSSGGSSGEEVLRSVISMSSRLIKKEHGLLAIVAEFMNPPTNDSGTDIAVTNSQDSLQKQQCQFLYKLCDWWERPPSWFSLLPSSDTSVDETCADIDAVAAARGLLFTNEAPVSPQKYAARRANDEKEYSAWLRNLQRHDIGRISPGLLYIETALKQTTMTTKAASSTSAQLILDLDYRLVPKCQELGSIRTPYNYKALLYTWCEWSAWRSAYSWDNPS
jgi:methylase of polypeptide subunit release factors